MNVLAISGSMRTGRLTGHLLDLVLEEMKRLEDGLQIESVQIAGLKLHPCRVDCSAFCTNRPYQCTVDDGVAPLLARMATADALLIGAPLYFRAPPVQFQALVERLISMFFFHESAGGATVPSPVAGKPCGLVAAAEYSNPQQILEYLHDFCLVLKMKPVTLDRFPYLGVAGQSGPGQGEAFQPDARARELAAALVQAARQRRLPRT